MREGRELGSIFQISQEYIIHAIARRTKAPNKKRKQNEAEPEEREKERPLESGIKTNKQMSDDANGEEFD